MLVELMLEFDGFDKWISRTEDGTDVSKDTGWPCEVAGC